MAQTEKSFFDFSRGINTEASLVAFPEGFSSDEENYEMQLDGSRRRRKGLSLETNGTTYSNTIGTGEVVQTFNWEEVEGNPGLRIIIIRAGTNLVFYEDEDAISSNRITSVLSLLNFDVPPATVTDVGTTPIDIAFGRGRAFVTGKYINPFWIRYDGANVFTVSSIDIRERDFEGVNDGVATTVQPVSSTSAHTYNLLNRGWKSADLTTFRTNQSREPSKAMIPWLGYRRVTTASVAEVDWTKAFSDAKLVAELFQDVSAPQGHFIRNPFDTTLLVSGGSGVFSISTWTLSANSPGTRTVTVTTTAAHGISATNTVSIEGNAGYYLDGSGNTKYFTLYGSYVVATVPTTTTFTFDVTVPSDFSSWSDQYAFLGTVTTGSNSNPEGYTVTVRPQAIAFHAGRVFYAGVPHAKVSTKIFFTQIIESDEQFGKCYQVADPTDERISDLLPTDGGVIVIPEANDVLKLIPFGASLLAFAKNGVWQIGPGTDGYFTATSYFVRKISNVGIVGSMAAAIFEDSVPYYAGKYDIFRIVQDTNSGFLFSENVTEKTIHTLYNTEVAQGFKHTIQAAYDSIKKRLVWLCQDNTSNNYEYDLALVLNLAYGAWTKHRFAASSAAYVASIVAIDRPIYNNQLKYICMTSTRTVISVCDFVNTTFQDFGTTEVSAYLVTGYDTFLVNGPQVIATAANFKHAPYIWVFSKKTETGYTSSGTDLIPVGESSTKMQARWDWADNSSAGKWGTSQEVYRHKRFYQPVDVSDQYADGQPLIVTRNKVRGRGRAIHLKFTAGTQRDSWLVGWHVRYNSVDT